MFRYPFSFDGRIRRTEYGLSYIIFIVFEIILEVTRLSTDIGDILYLGYIPGYWFLLAQGAKRCHDRDNSGWYQLIPFYVFWMLFADGEPQTNQYGDDPKGRGDLVEQLLSEEQETTMA